MKLNDNDRNIQVGIHNEFEIVVTDAKTGKVKERAKSQNIMLNQFWTRFLSSNNSSCLYYIHFGSGSTTPVATDTSLTSFLGAKSSANITQDLSTFASDGIIKKKCSIRLQDTEYQNTTISEVGFGYSASSSSLMTKSLVKDQNGNALSISKGTSDIVDIYATFFVKIPTLNSGKVYFDILESPDSYILGFLCCYGAPGSLTGGYYHNGYRTPKVMDPYYSYGYSMGTPTISYNTSAKTMTLTPPNIIAANGNIGGIETMNFQNMTIELPQTGFTQPVLTKEVIATGDGSTKDFKCEFGRILNNGTAKLYVNDVEVSATFDYEMPGPHQQISQWMPILSMSPNPTKLGAAGSQVILENPFYDKFGLSVIAANYFKLYASNDLSNWVLAASNSGTGSYGNENAIDSTYKNYRYWKLTPYESSQGVYFKYIGSADCLANKVIHAAEAPASGATVALTYQPRCLAKNASHVINNMSVVLTFNEYTP